MNEQLAAMKLKDAQHDQQLAAIKLKQDSFEFDMKRREDEFQKEIQTKRDQFQTKCDDLVQLQRQSILIPFSFPNHIPNHIPDHIPNHVPNNNDTTMWDILTAGLDPYSPYNPPPFATVSATGGGDGSKSVTTMSDGQGNNDGCRSGCSTINNNNNDKSNTNNHLSLNNINDHNNQTTTTTTSTTNMSITDNQSHQQHRQQHQQQEEQFRKLKFISKQVQNRLNDAIRKENQVDIALADVTRLRHELDREMESRWFDLDVELMNLEKREADLNQRLLENQSNLNFNGKLIPPTTKFDTTGLKSVDLIQFYNSNQVRLEVVNMMGLTGPLANHILVDLTNDEFESTYNPGRRDLCRKYEMDRDVVQIFLGIDEKEFQTLVMKQKIIRNGSVLVRDYRRCWEIQ